MNLRIDSLSKGTIDLLLCPSVLHGVLTAQLYSNRESSMSIPSKTVQNHLCASNFRVASAQLTFFAAQGQSSQKGQ